MQSLLPVCVDVAGLKADAATIDLLARVALGLRRHGYRLRLRDPSPELLELIELAGLSSVLVPEQLT